MKNLLYTIGILAVLGLFGTTNQVQASHAVGVDFTATCVGKDSFLITFNFFRDCDGINAPTSVTPTFTSSCGQTVTQQLSLVSSGAVEVSMICGNMINQSSCNSSASNAIFGVQLFTYQAIIVIPSPCGGGVTAAATGGSPGYMFNWSNGTMGPSNDDLCAGTYLVTVVDNNGCEAVDSVSLNGMNPFPSATVSVTHPTCPGACTGTATVTPTPATGTFTYYWSDGGSGNSRTGLCPGNYSVTLMDNTGKQFRHYVAVNAPDPLFVGHQTTDESCPGANDGFIFAPVNGGTAPYTYAWSGGLSGPINNNVSPGTYTLTITDANGCTQVSSTTVNPGAGITASINQNALVVCNGGCTGQLVASATGGVGLLTYDWSHGASGQFVTGLCAGLYTVTVSDSLGCTTIANYTITQPSAVTVSSTLVDATCGQSNGSASVTVAGGTAPYTYAWGGIAPNPGNVASVTGIAAGSYDVTVSDLNGCQAVASIPISNTTGPNSAGLTVSAPSCANGTNGGISASPSGGNAPYTYSWSTGATTASISGLSSGTYTVVITDNSGCKLVANGIVVDPAAIAANESITNVSCNGQCNGSIVLNPNGGNGNYTYSWNTGASSSSILNVCAGTYSVTISDGLSCSVIDTFQVGEPDTLQGTISIDQDVLCHGDSNGQLRMTPTGGTKPYTYNWSTGSTLEAIFLVSQGNYSVTVTDANGCTIVDSVSLVQPQPLTASVTIKPGSSVGCSGTWTASWSTCCRNGAISNIQNPASQGQYAAATFNVATPNYPDCNSGVQFDNTQDSHPVRYLCVGDSICYNLGAYDPDNDSLFFEMIAAPTSATATVTYNTGYNYLQPIPNLTLDPNTGEMCFTATVAGVFVVTVRVSEYDRATGLYLGDTFRDIQYNIMNCAPNSYPYSTGIQNVQGSGGVNQLDSNSIEVCEGDSFCFDVTFLDSNLADTNIYGFYNTTNILVGPGVNDTATVVWSTPDTVVIGSDSLMRMTATLCWTAPQTGGGFYQFYLAVNDDHCTVPKDHFFSMDLEVVTSTVTNPDLIICGSQSAPLSVTGGSSFVWTSIAGDPIIVGQNFDCDTCANVVATPSQTTTYVVTSNLSSTCKNADTVTVVVAPNYNVFSGPDTILCEIDSIQMVATPSIPGTYSYQWSDGNTMNDDTLFNPIAAPQITTFYSVTVTSAQGCIKTGGHTIQHTPPFPDLDITTSDSSLCDSDTAFLSLTLGAPAPAACGPAAIPCVGSTNTQQVGGTGTTSNTSSSYPAAYGNFRRSARHQFLYRANELTTAGYSAGKITGIGFEVTALNNIGSLQNYTIKVGCTSLNSMPYAWQGNLTQVYSGTVSPMSGWNYHTFTTPYNWDGTSNVIVEICFDNGTTVTSNASTRYHNAGFNSTIYYSTSFGTVACASTSISSVTAIRPDTRFQFCGTADSTFYDYSWTLGISLSNSLSLNPVATPTSTTTYLVSVADTLGVCEDTASITIFVSEIDAGNDTLVCEGDSIQLQPTALQSCNQGSGTFTWTPTTGLSNPYILNPVAQVNQTITYTITYNDPCGCILEDSVTIFVNNMTAPNGVLTQPDCGLNNGEILVQNNGGSSPFTYSIDGGTSYFIDSLFTGLSLGYYGLMVQDSIGCVSPMQVDTLLNPGAPVIDSVDYEDLSCFQALDGIIYAFGSGGTAPLEFSIDSGLTFQGSGLFTGLDSGWYNVVVRDDSSCVSLPDSVYLDMNAQIQIDSINLSDLNCYDDASGEIAVFGSGGTPPLEYSIDNGISFQLSNVFNGLAAGPYLVTVRDSKNCSIPAVQQVLNEPTEIVLGLTTNDVDCFNGCNGSALATVSGGTVPYDTMSYQNSIGVIVSTGSYQVNNLCAENYTYHVVDANGCIADTGFAITQPTLLQIDSTVSTNISCYGKADGTIKVYPSGGTGPYIFSADSGNTWTPNTFFGAYQFTYQLAGTYDVMVQDANGCIAYTTVALTEPPLVDIAVQFTQDSICVGNCITIGAQAGGGSGGPYVYNWNANLGNSQTHTVCPDYATSAQHIYIVMAEDINGCRSKFDTVTIDFFEPLSVLPIDDVDICPEDTAQLGVIASGGDGNGYNYVWSPVLSMDNPYVRNPKVSPAATQTYSVRVTDNCGSPEVTTSVDVVVNPLPIMDFYGIDTLRGCEPFDVVLINTSTPAQFCWWTVGDDIEATGFEAAISDLSVGTYDVHLQVRTPAGCLGEITKEDYLTVYPLPTADFMMGPQPTTVFNTVINFENESMGNVVDYLWTFNELETSSLENPTFQFPADTGFYPVNLTVTTNYGCVDDTNRQVRIGAEYNMYIPNSFTPNGDGLNDVFAPIGLGVDPDEYSLVVYDRWGALIFESNSLSIPWDGRVQATGDMANEGSYVWRVIANDYTEEQNRNEYYGYINLLR